MGGVMIDFVQTIIELLKYKIGSGMYVVEICINADKVRIRVEYKNRGIGKEISVREIGSYLHPKDMARIYVEDMIAELEKS
jgi:hypothetical protein